MRLIIFLLSIIFSTASLAKEVERVDIIVSDYIDNTPTFAITPSIFERYKEQKDTLTFFYNDMQEEVKTFMRLFKRKKKFRKYIPLMEADGKMQIYYKDGTSEIWYFDKFLIFDLENKFYYFAQNLKEWIDKAFEKNKNIAPFNHNYKVNF